MPLFEKVIEAVFSKERPRTRTGGQFLLPGKAVNAYIAGQWVLGEGWEHSIVKNPATEEPLAVVYDASLEQIQRAFRAAREAQEYWRFSVGEQEKEAILRRTAEYIDSARGAIAWVIVQEAGKLAKWAEAEVQEVLDTVWHYHGEVSRIHGKTGRCQMRDKMSFTFREPYGVILGITPWNFPVAVPSWKIFAAIAGDNAIVVKAAEQTPVSLSILCYLFAAAVRRELGDERAANLGGLLQVLHGRGETTGSLILDAGDYDKVMFTGGSETGAIVAETAGRRGKPVSLELGGHAAIILMDDFDVDRAVAEAVNANCGDSGQRCVSLREVFVEESAAREFTRRYIDRIADLRIGSPSDYSVEMGPLVSADQVAAVARGVKQSLTERGALLHGGYPFASGMLRTRFHNVAPEVWHRGCYFPPTLIEARETPVFAETTEIFGPVLVVRPFSGATREEAFLGAIERVNSSLYGLSNAVMTNRYDLAMRAMERVKTGILYIGRGTTGAEVGKPFGGVKRSGFGREGYGIEEVTYEKQVYVDYHGKPRMAQAGAAEAVKKTLADSEYLGRSVFAAEKQQ